MTSTQEKIPQSNVKASRRRKPRKTGGSNDQENARPNKAAVENHPMGKDESNGNDSREERKKIHDLSLKFMDAEKHVQTGIWDLNGTLREAVAQCSVKLGSLDDALDDNLLLLSEYEVTLVKTARLLVKEAIEKKLESDKLPRLFMATHMIRTLSRFVIQPSTQEALLQVLYHTINTLGTEKFATDEGLIFEAFEAMYHVLLRYKKECQGVRISFSTSVDDRVFLFPVPTYRKVNSPKTESGLSTEKLFAIAIQSMIVVCRSIFESSNHITQNGLPSFLRRLDDQPLQTARKLMTHVAVYWIHHLVKIGKDIKGAIADCKRVHRLLWEQAASPNQSPVDRLNLRHDAISVLLLGDSVTLCRSLERKFADTVCSYALKTSSTFLQEVELKNDDIQLLTDFHRKIGSVLDRIYEGKLGLSYVEYCAIRAQHTGLRPSKIKLEGQPDQRVMEWILQIALSSAGIIQFLDTKKSYLVMATDITNASFKSFKDSTLDTLNCCWSSEEIHRIIKVLQLVQLTKSLYVATNKDEVDQISSVLKIGAFILIECIGPFLLRAATTMNIEKKKLCEKGVDCFLRGVAVFEKVQSYSNGHDESLKASVALMRLCTDRGSPILDQNTFPLFEKFAKFLSSSSRQREEKGFLKPSLQLQLSSLRIYTMISKVSTGSPDFLMLSQRWSCLSSLFTSIGCRDAGYLTELVALFHDACENDQEEDFQEKKFLTFLCSRSNGDLDLWGWSEGHCQSDQRRSIINRLLRAIKDTDVSSYRPAKSEQPKALSLESIFECLEGVLDGTDTVAQFIEERCAVPFTLSGLLRIMLPRNAVISGENESVNMVTAKLRLLVDIIVELGIGLQSGLFMKDEVFQQILRCHQVISRLASNFLENGLTSFTSPEYVAVSKGILFYCTSTSLLPSELYAKGIWDSAGTQMTCEQQTLVLSTAKKFVDEALLALSQANDSEWESIAVALKPIFIHSRLLGKHRVDESDLNDSIEFSMIRILQFPGISTGATSQHESMAVHMLLSFLSYRAECLFARGEGFSALRLAHWCFQIASSLNSDNKDEIEVSYSQMLSPYTILSNIDVDEDADAEASFANIELRANRDSCKLFAIADRSSIDHICSRLENQLKYEPIANPKKADVIRSLWVQTALSQTLALGCSRIGDFNKAINLYKQSLRSINQALMASTRQLSNLSRTRGSLTSDLSLFQKIEVRQVDLLLAIAWVCRFSGDYRKAETYAHSAVKCILANSSSKALELPQDTRDLINFLYARDFDIPRFTELRRIFLDFVISRSTQDAILAALSAFPSHVINPLNAVSEDDENLDGVLEGVSRLRLLEFAQVNREIPNLQKQTRDLLQIMKGRDQLNVLAQLLAGTISPLPEAELDLFEARSYLASLKDQKEAAIARQKCEFIVAAPLMSSRQRSEALYLLGIVHLQKARVDGSLSRLWHGYSNQEGTRLLFDIDDDKSLLSARQYFMDALCMHGPASDLMTRNILRSLALVCGPDDTSTTMSSWEMIHSSIGSTARQRVRQKFSSELNCESAPQNQDDIFDILASLDAPFFSNERSKQVATLVRSLELLMPKSWKTVAVVACPTGEILLNSVEIEGGFVSRTVCVFPDAESPVFETMMQPLDELINDSQCQLQGDTSTGPATDDKSHRREWWSRREQIDDQLDSLSRTVERKFFSSPCVQTLLFDESDENTNSISSDCDDSEIHSTHCDVESPLKDTPDLEELKVADLRQELVQQGMLMSDLRKMRRRELVQRLLDFRRRDESKLSLQKGRETMSGSSKYLLLLLDEDLHRFPVESLPCLRNRIVCRSPCIAFVAAKLLELKQDSRDADMIYIDPKQSSYIIDPECNLMATRDRMSEFLSIESRKYGVDWSNLVGEIPPKDFFHENLVREESMFLFFGHGGGQAYFSRPDIENLVLPGRRSIKASIVLMGCSSGQLVSVNRKKLHVPRKVPLLYEPEGLAQSYITAGAPCVVGNLWDVTDRDIDRLSIDMLSRFYNGEDLAGSLMRARSVCKMRFLNGHAPVYYGIPVFPRGLPKKPC